MTASLLPIPDDPRLTELQAAFPRYQQLYAWPRSQWLKDYEAILREYYPAASSRDRSFTARWVAPFPLAQPGTP